MTTADSRIWLHDVAHRAVEQWLRGWRVVNASAALPSLAFARHLGNHARTMTRDLPPGDQAEVLRRFNSAGYQGTCVCGRDALGWTDDNVERREQDDGTELKAPIDLPKWMLEAYSKKT